MNAPPMHSRDPQVRTWSVAAVVTLQSLAAAFFVVDAIADFGQDGLTAHLAMEGPIAIALFAGIGFGAWQLRKMLADARRSDAALAAASGALAKVIQARFVEWGLTVAEADVALFALKGCDVAEIARLRNAAKGTVRAQLARAYAKAGVGSRAALVCVFIEDLLSGATALPAGGGESAASARAGDTYKVRVA